jgi:FMN phosphatase YigB (HAD superfamily)
MIIGDSLSSDILGGSNAGIKTCWFNPNNLPNSLDIQIDYQISSLIELKKIL